MTTVSSSPWSPPKLGAAARRRHAVASFAVSAMLLTGSFLVGCANGRSEDVAQPVPDAAAADRLAIRAGELLTSDPQEAERLLTEALRIDLYCGPAYNNLGSLMMRGRPPSNQPDLFAAAENFQAACRLMPGRAAPRLNLGLVMERAGRLDDALSAYQSAVDCAPGDLPSVQALTSLELRTARTSELTRNRLSLISLQGTDVQWRAWAKDQLLRSGGR